MFTLIAYIIGTLLMLFGWICALAQGDAPTQNPRISGIVAIFLLALVLLIPVAVRLSQAKRAFRLVLLAVIGVQALICLFAIAAEFML